LLSDSSWAGLREVDGEVERDVEVLARRAQWRRDRSARLAP